MLVVSYLTGAWILSVKVSLSLLVTVAMFILEERKWLYMLCHEAGNHVFVRRKWTNARCWWTMAMVLRFGGLSRVIAMARLHSGDQLQPNKIVELGTGRGLDRQWLFSAAAAQCLAAAQDRSVRRSRCPLAGQHPLYVCDWLSSKY
jgi:hypothetical protein